MNRRVVRRNLQVTGVALARTDARAEAITPGREAGPKEGQGRAELCGRAHELYTVCPHTPAVRHTGWEDSAGGWWLLAL